MNGTHAGFVVLAVVGAILAVAAVALIIVRQLRRRLIDVDDSDSVSTSSLSTWLRRGRSGRRRPEFMAPLLQLATDMPIGGNNSMMMNEKGEQEQLVISIQRPNHSQSDSLSSMGSGSAHHSHGQTNLPTPPPSNTHIYPSPSPTPPPHITKAPSTSAKSRGKMTDVTPYPLMETMMQEVDLRANPSPVTHEEPWNLNANESFSEIPIRLRTDSNSNLPPGAMDPISALVNAFNPGYPRSPTVSPTSSTPPSRYPSLTGSAVQTSPISNSQGFVFPTFGPNDLLRQTSSSSTTTYRNMNPLPARAVFAVGSLDNRKPSSTNFPELFRPQVPPPVASSSSDRPGSPPQSKAYDRNVNAEQHSQVRVQKISNVSVVANVVFTDNGPTVIAGPGGNYVLPERPIPRMDSVPTFNSSERIRPIPKDLPMTVDDSHSFVSDTDSPPLTPTSTSQFPSRKSSYRSIAPRLATPHLPSIDLDFSNFAVSTPGHSRSSSSGTTAAKNS